MELNNYGTVRMSVVCAFPHLILSPVAKKKLKQKTVSSCNFKRDGARLRAKLKETKRLFSDSTV